jgi:hypothetical protein
MIAIHHRPGSFSDKWIEYCERHAVRYKVVDCYQTDFIHHVRELDGFLWHWNHLDHKAALFARQLTYALEHIGKQVFPDSRTCWHFDDKVGQKYLLEAIQAPMVPSYVFYDKKEALHWAAQTTYPKVFKLRGGASSENVRLVSDKHHAERMIHRAFRKGFKAKNRTYFLNERLWQFSRDRTLKSFLGISKGLARLVIPTKIERLFPTERNYAYFQDFVPGNDFDIRVVVIYGKAFAIKRFVRDNDFRASGSGRIEYGSDNTVVYCVKEGFGISRRLKTQCVAMDFVFLDGKPQLIEISYAFAHKAYLNCPGYWTERMEWVPGAFLPQDFMIEGFLESLSRKAGR